MTLRAGYGKIVFALLDKVVIILMQLITINVWGFRFKSPLRETLRSDLISATTK